MEVRQQLRDLFEDLQVAGSIVLERPSSSTPRVLRRRRWQQQQPQQQQQPPAPLPPSLPLPPPLPSSPPLDTGLLPNEWTTFHCCGCWTVLGDSLHLCSQQQRLGILICLKVTKDVVWKKSLLVGLEGTLLGCTYYPLSCQSCGMVVGFILYSATRRLAYLRGFFCFFMDRILCYILTKQKTVRASKVNFPDENVKEKVQKIKEKIVKIHFRIELLMKQLEEVAQKNEAEMQNSPVELVNLPPGYAIVRVNP